MLQIAGVIAGTQTASKASIRYLRYARISTFDVARHPDGFLRRLYVYQ